MKTTPSRESFFQVIRKPHLRVIKLHFHRSHRSVRHPDPAFKSHSPFIRRDNPTYFVGRLMLSPLTVPIYGQLAFLPIFLPLVDYGAKFFITASRLAQWIERCTVVREVEGSSPGRTNTQGLKIIEKNPLPFYNIKKLLDILVFSDRDE